MKRSRNDADLGRDVLVVEATTVVADLEQPLVTPVLRSHLARGEPCSVASACLAMLRNAPGPRAARPSGPQREGAAVKVDVDVQADAL
jgi:hypothetical protein